MANQIKNGILQRNQNVGVDLLIQLAQYCIKHNLYRQGNEFYYFSEEEMDHINKCSLNKTNPLESGFMFLDNPNGTEGLIRLSWL